ncbi:hypothetical protein D030_5356B, partial [Vibrio parahaemolyticus AQ3810]|jgi:hypothetical protein
VAKH